MIKELLATLCCFLLITAPAFGAITISSFPHSEDFSTSTNWSDTIYVMQGATAARVQQSWRGGGNYCAKFTPPDSGIDNGGNWGLAGHTFSATANLSISFAFYVGTSVASTVASYAGGGTYWKFINVRGGGEWEAMVRFHQHPVNLFYELSAVQYNNDSQLMRCYDDGGGVPTDCENTGTVFMDDGNPDYYGGTDDYAGQWMWINFVLTPTTQTIYIYDRNGNRTGEFITMTGGSSPNYDNFEVNYANGQHRTQDANTYMMIDDLYITNTSTPHTVPDGFVGGSPTPTGSTANTYGATIR
jgi:hypothetical protein